MKAVYNIVKKTFHKQNKLQRPHLHYDGFLPEVRSKMEMLPYQERRPYWLPT